jgi:mannose-6-phosphate isomerase-like protein (cupin superfamily)
MNNDILVDMLTQFDVEAIRRSVSNPWFNQALCRVNDCVLRMGVVQGQFHWHKHDNEDELFFVLSGALFVEVEGQGEIKLEPNQGYAIPKGVMHRTRASESTMILIINGVGVDPTGD